MLTTPRLLAMLLTALLTVAALSGGAGLAGAHAALVSTSPAAEDDLQEAPASVTATFSEDLQPEFAAMTVIGPDGRQWSSGAVRVRGPIAEVDLAPHGPSGTYTVNYRVTSADGHVIAGSWSFDLEVPAAPDTTSSTTPALPAPAPTAVSTPAPSAERGLPSWPFWLAASAVLVVGAGWLRSRRR